MLEHADEAKRLREMTDRLARVMKPEYVQVWLQSPVPALGGTKPIDLIARGQYQAVAEVIAELEYPGAS